MNAAAICVLMIRGCLLSHVVLAAENLALRQQLAVFLASSRQPNVRKRDRIFWGVDVVALVGLAVVPRDRQARDGDPLASMRDSSRIGVGNLARSLGGRKPRRAFVF